MRSVALRGFAFHRSSLPATPTLQERAGSIYDRSFFIFFFPLLSLDEAVGESFTTSRSRYAGYSFPQPAHASMPSDWCFAFIPLPLYGVVSYTFRMR